MPTKEYHRIHRSSWLRAAVLGANDGIVSTASLMAGVAAAGNSQAAILSAGLAGLVAGALSMAVGEYISVRSQADIEAADLTLEERSLQRNAAGELQELADIYIQRGLSSDLAKQVAGALMAHDALDAHARDELGISATTRARPIQAALTSALSFATGAALPLLLAVLLVHTNWYLLGLTLVSVVSLGLLGAMAAWVGGAPKLVAAGRVALLGALAIGVTAGVGSLVGVAA
jgi:VIT1/CCC1 family predicted Fe2+/Mn2+ transporter